MSKQDTVKVILRQLLWSQFVGAIVLLITNMTCFSVQCLHNYIHILLELRVLCNLGN